MNKPVLTGHTGYAPVAGAEFPIRTSAPRAWVSPLSGDICRCELCACARRVFAKGDMLDINAMDPLDPAHLRNTNRDLDKEKAAAEGDDYDVAPQQGGGR